MVSELQKLERLATGLTQQDAAFREALEDLSGTPVNFYTNKQRAYTRLNHLLVGAEADLMYPVTVVGVFDREQGTLQSAYNGQTFTYNVDELDPEYVRTLNQIATKQGLGADAKTLPLTDLAMELLDDLHEDAERKPELEDREYALETKPRRVLQRAFENEILFNIQLQRYIDDNHLGREFDSYSDEMTDLIGGKRFEASFNDGLEHIDSEMSMLTEPEVEQ